MTNEPTADELRELDAWIAEHVMGWTVFDPNWRGEGFIVWSTGCEENPTQSRFQPTANRGDAMMVQEKCIEKLGAIKLHKKDDQCWICMAMNPIHQSAFHYGETLPLAICRFAKALFGEGKE